MDTISHFWGKLGQNDVKNEKIDGFNSVFLTPKNGRTFLWKFANARSFFDFSWGGGISQNASIISSIIFNFWLVTSVILILKCALKAPKNDVLETISSQICQNWPIISSIISNFWSITIVILILKVIKHYFEFLVDNNCDFDP